LKRSISSLLTAAAILLCTSFAAHAQSLGTFACSSGANTVSFNVGYFNVGVSDSPLSGLLTDGHPGDNTLELHVALGQFASLYPLSHKSATLHSCTLSATLPSGLNVQYLFNTVTLQAVNAMAHSGNAVKGTNAGGHTRVIATFSGMTDQSSGGSDDGGSGNTTTPPAPKS
jgi:hypothetical protein